MNRKMISFLDLIPSELSLAEREMLIQAIARELVLLKFIADKYKIQKICEKAVEVEGWTLRYAPDQFKTQEMCNKAILEDSYFLVYLPDNLKT